MDRPDQPWQPRHPSSSSSSPDGDKNGKGDGSGSGSSGDRPAWGSQWSDQQPGRGNGGFGSRPGGNGTGGQGGPERNPGGLRWDPTDPAQRRARYAVLGGMWAFFFALFDFPEVALLLGALSVYWALSSLRAKPGSPSAKPGSLSAKNGAAGAAGAGAGTGATAVTGTEGAEGRATPPAPGTPPATAQGGSTRPQTTAAVSGLVTALLALSIVATTFTVQLVYRDYYTCVNDALTKSGALACNDLLPKPLEPFFGVKE